MSCLSPHKQISTAGTKSLGRGHTGQGLLHWSLVSPRPARGWGHTLPGGGATPCPALDTAVASLQERWGHTCQELSELAALVNIVRHTWHHHWRTYLH